jgi:hypothetical protein
MNEYLNVGQTSDALEMLWFTNAYANYKVGHAWILHQFIQKW